MLDRSFLPGMSALMVPKTDDGRVLFAIPWHDRVLVGTTDTPVESMPIEPRPLEAELAFLKSHTGRYLGREPRDDEVLSAFAGLRPLIDPGAHGKTSALSREHAVVVSESGLVTITGGKWTTYRRMGADAVDSAMNVAGLYGKPSATENLRLHGWSDAPPDGPLAVYGAEAEALERLMAERAELAELLHPSLPYRAAEVVWAARHEQARTVEDVLARRTRALLLDARASREAAPRVTALLAAELGFDDAWQAAQVEQYQELAGNYIL